jgi:hypothetical protein
MEERRKTEEKPAQDIMTVLLAVAEKILANISAKRRRYAREVL